MEKKCAIALFTGQGSQYIGMGAELYHTATGKAVIDSIAEATTPNLIDLIQKGPTEELNVTENLQPAIYAVSMAAVKLFEETYGPMQQYFDYYIGHSMGEYTAAVTAHMISLQEGAHLLRVRGLAMKEAGEKISEGTVVAVLGISVEQIKHIFTKQHITPEALTIANDNGNNQVILSGKKSVADDITPKLKEAGAKRVLPLPITVPVHSVYMKPAVPTMEKAFAQIHWNKPSIPLIMNASAQAETDPKTIQSLLLSQLYTTVRFRESVNHAIQYGANLFVEFGPKNVLVNLIKRSHAIVQVLAIETPAEVKNFSHA